MDSEKILVVEDENIVALDIKRNLEKFGYQVTDMCSSGEEALEVVARERPQLVLMDIQLQGELDGIETAEKIRSTYYIPVVMLTAYADEATLDRVKVTEPFGYIIKPFEERELRTVIEMALYRNDMERKLVERKKLFFTTLRSINDAVVVTDNDSKIQFLNPVAEKLAGISDQNANGMLYSSLFKLENLTINDKFSDFANRCRRLKTKENTLLVEEKIAPLLDETDTRSGNVIVLHDVTEQIQAEEDLKTNEEKYRRFFEEDLSGNFVTDNSGVIEDCNSSFVRLLGYSNRDNLIGVNINEFFDNKEDADLLWERLYEEGSIRLFETAFRSAKGKPLTVLANIIAQVNKDNSIGEVKGYVLDTTERKHLEEQLRQSQKMEAIGRLAGGIAHDFNNLLTVIMGYSNIVLEGMQEDSQWYGDIIGIQNAVKKAVTLTRQLLAFSRHQVLKPEIVDINKLIEDMKKMIRRLITENIDMHAYLDADKTNIKVDPGQLEQVIINLVVNAKDAMPEGGTLIIQTENIQVEKQRPLIISELPPGQYVVMTMRDNGQGMDSTLIEKIFDPFFTTKEKGKGTGLGLSTVYGIVQQSNGYIDVETEKGKGTAFHLYFPLSSEVIAAKKPEKSLMGVDNGNEMILVVEDEDAVRKFITKILYQKGFEVLEAKNGGEAILLCEEHKNDIQLVLSDVVMPFMDGGKLVDRLTQIQPDLKVILMSGYPDGTISEKQPGTQDFIFMQKPFEPETLLNNIRKALDYDKRKE